jgi:DNA-binding LytR/AlgR family response regulator
VIRAVLVDDEPLALEELEFILSKVSYVQIVRTFTDALEALNFIKMEEPDVVFMDIDMPQMSGIELTEQLKRVGMDTKVIYATAYDDYAIKAFDQSALDYLLKPYDAERIYSAVLKVKRTKGAAEASPSKTQVVDHAIKRLPVWIGEKMLLIDIEDIIFCSVDHNRTTIKTVKTSYEINDGLTHLESRLPKERFMRTHRAYIVNLLKIKEIAPYFNNTLVLKLEGSNDEIPVSRSYLKAFKAALNIN